MQCPGPGLAPDNLPGCEAELGTRASDWLRLITWPSYWPLIGHQMPGHVSCIQTSHWLVVSDAGSSFAQSLASCHGIYTDGELRVFLGECSLCSDWLSCSILGLILDSCQGMMWGWHWWQWEWEVWRRRTQHCVKVTGPGPGQWPPSLSLSEPEPEPEEKSQCESLLCLLCQSTDRD